MDDAYLGNIYVTTVSSHWFHEESPEWRKVCGG